MDKRITSKYAFDELLKSGLNAFAVTDKNLKILEFSKGFKNNFSSKRLKDRYLFKIIDLPFSNENLPQKETVFYIKAGNLNSKLLITPVKRQKSIEGYLVELSSDKLEAQGKEIELPSEAFQKQQQEILALLLKENSLNKLASEILKRSVLLSRSSYGITVIYSDGNEHEYMFHDPGNLIPNSNEIRKTVGSKLSFLDKWLTVNKTPLLVRNSPENIGYNLLREFEGTSAIIAPCFFEDKLLAVIIVVNKNKVYHKADIENITRIAPLLSFAITSIKTRELNAALEGRLLQAQKLETIGKLSSGMAHDFNNLLSSIFGSLNLLKKRVPESENVTRLLDNIENCSIRAKDLTKGLLSFGKPTPKRKELIKPNLLLSEISKVINQTFPGRISFINNLEENLYDVLGNGTEIYQVLLNLCVNAKEAIEGHGEIRLNAQNVTIDKNNIVNHPFLELGNYVWISVKDSGSGIDEENLNKIFDPYFSTKNKNTGSGSGLGLYVSYGIIKAHKGNIEVSSIVGEGTTFDVFIPAYEPTKTSKAIGSGKIILLADDELMLRDLLAELLESYGYNVIKVISGVEALKILTEEIKVNLAIIDYNMPEMDGLECIRKIRELKFDIPIILSSGSLIENFDDSYKEEGINAVVTKPYEFDTMLDTIQKLI